MLVSISKKFKFEELWNFYLETNFLYKEKIQMLGSDVEQIKDTWSKIIESSEDVSYTTLRRDSEDNPTNSLSVMKYYDDTWIFQHMVSKKCPLGMVEVLKDSVDWLVSNEKILFAKLYWRPNNGIPNQMFSAIETYLCKEPNSYLYESFDYFALTKHDNNILKYPNNKFKSKVATSIDHTEISEILKDNIDPIIFNSDSLDKLSMPLLKTAKIFNDNNLERKRQFILTKKDSKILAITAVEFSSKGLSLSHYFNKFSIYYINKNITTEEETLIGESILSTVLSFYKELKRDVFISLCDKKVSLIFQKLGLNPKKRYKCLTISRNGLSDKSQKGGFYNAVSFLEKFYKKRVVKYEQN